MSREFILGFFNVYAAAHGMESIYVGHDQSVNWSVFMNGEWESIDGARTLKQAKELGHTRFDGEKSCSLKLDWRKDWHLVDETRSNVANACPECGNPATDDDEDESARRCPDCGWERHYTAKENEDLKSHRERAASGLPER